MRVEPYGVDSIIHIVKRGTRGMPIVRDDADRKRFVNLVWCANDEFRDQYWEQSIKCLPQFTRPQHWPESKPLVQVLAWTLMSNHFHLIVREFLDKGMSRFMQKLCGSMTTHFNAKYDERGSLFQGAYRGKTADIHGDEYLRLLAVYVMIKNPFEIYPGGLKHAIENFDEAFEWARTYTFCSLGDFLSDSTSPIIEKNFLTEMFESSADFVAFAKECMLSKLERLKEIRT